MLKAKIFLKTSVFWVYLQIPNEICKSRCGRNARMARRTKISNSSNRSNMARPARVEIESPTPTSVPPRAVKYERCKKRSVNVLSLSTVPRYLLFQAFEFLNLFHCFHCLAIGFAFDPAPFLSMFPIFSICTRRGVAVCMHCVVFAYLVFSLIRFHLATSHPLHLNCTAGVRQAVRPMCGQDLCPDWKTVICARGNENKRVTRNQIMNIKKKI